MSLNDLRKSLFYAQFRKPSELLSISTSIWVQPSHTPNAGQPYAWRNIPFQYFSCKKAEKRMKAREFKQI